MKNRVGSIGRRCCGLAILAMAVSQPLAAQESTYYFPHLAVGGEWQTTITYINYSPQEVRCETDFTSDDGGPLLVSFPTKGMDISRSDVLPPGGSVHEETNVDLSAPLGGWARATCSGPVKASLLYRRRDSEGLPTGEAAVNATTVPATRFVTFAEQGEGEGKHGTGVAYANPSDTTTAFVTFTVRDAAGNELPPSAPTLTLLPRGHDAKNMVDLFDLHQLYRIARSHLHGAHRQLCPSMPRPLPYSPPCLRVNWMLPCRERLPITSLILPWEGNGKPR